MNIEAQTMNEELVAAEVTDHDYGYEECESATGKPPLASFDAICPHESCSPNHQEKEVYSDPTDCYALPPDRLARKQRHFSRRGGAGHSDLLRSAVIASMEISQDISDDDGIGIGAGRQRRDSLTSLQDSVAMGHVSPRKRARLYTKEKGSAINAAENDETDIEVIKASQLFLSMCKVKRDAEVKESSSKEPVRKPPPRRVSRRTSYDSRISDVSDDLDLDISEFDD